MIIVRNLASLAACFQKSERRDDGFMVSCPCHDDRTPSLSLSKGHDGNLLYNCFAGCDAKALGEAIWARGSEYLERRASGVGRRSAANELTNNKSLAVMPVPTEAPEPDLRLGRPLYPQSGYFLTESWEYRNANDQLLQLTCRFQEATPQEGTFKPQKRVLPYCYFAEGGWKHKGSGRSSELIYGLDRLAKRPDSAVLLVEGEKTADAAMRLFPELVAISWLGGSKKVLKVDWSCLRGRTVSYWPDADDAGRSTIPFIIEQLRNAEVSSLRVVSLPLGLPSGWDLADAAPDYFDIEFALSTAVHIDLHANTLFQRLSAEELIKRVVYNSGTEQFIDLNSDLRLAPSQIDAIFRHHGKLKSGRMTLTLLENPLLQKVFNLTYQPGDGRKLITNNGITMLNTWRPSDIEPVEGDAEPFVEHLKYLCSTNDEFEFLADTLAFMVQHLGKKLRFAPVLIGREGTGKSYIGTTMRKLLGLHNTTSATASEIHSQFTEWVVEKTLVVVEEIMALGRREIMNTLKPLITEEKITVNIKHQRRFDIENKANFLFLSNHEDALRLEGGDRRYFVVMTESEPKGKEYYQKLYDWTEKNYGSILNWLLNRNLERFSPNARPKDTEGKRRMIEASRPEGEAIVHEMVANLEGPFAGDLIVLSDAHEAIFGYAALGYRCRISIPRFRTLLAEIGAAHLKQQKATINGNVVRLSLWAIRNKDRYLRLSSKALLEEYLRQKAQEARPS